MGDIQDLFTHALMEEGMRGTSSVLAIDRSLHMWSHMWRAWGPKYGQSKLHVEAKKTCTSSSSDAGGSACRAPIEQGMCGTSSALVIERALHVLAPWRARRPNHGPVKMARLKRENAVSDAQINDVGTREDNQTSDT